MVGAKIKNIMKFNTCKNVVLKVNLNMKSC